MRSRLLILSVAGAAIMVSCSRHEASLAGSYGDRVVSGQVVMASEMANSSPAGVEVSVVGTTMRATLAADGRFTFIGVPAGAELTYHRGDRVDTHLDSDALGASPRVIELSHALQTTAIKVRGNSNRS